MLFRSPVPWLKEGVRGSGVEAALRGEPLPLAAYSVKHPRLALAQAAPVLAVKELEVTSFAGKPVYLAREAMERSLIVPMEGVAAQEFPQDRIVEVIASASRPATLAEARLVVTQEAYYVDRHHERPLPVLFVRLNDPAGSMYYIDPRTARVVQGYTTGSRWNRWLYHGLHSLDLPWLYLYRPAWDIVVLTLMLGGTALCVTSVVIGWRRLKRKAAMRRAERTRRQRLSLRTEPVQNC